MEQNNKRARLLYILVLLLGIVLVATFYLYRNINNSTTFAYGVEIGGIPVQGFSLDGANQAVKEGIDEFAATTVTFYKDDYSLESKLGDLYVEVDALPIVQSVWQSEADREWLAKVSNLIKRDKIAYPVSISYDSAQKDVYLEEWNNKWGQPAQDASLEIAQGGLEVIPSQTGIKVNAELSFEGLPLEMKQTTPLRIPIVMETIEPEVTADMLQNMGELSNYSTYFNTGEINRSHNLQMATASINKKVLAPNTVFSFNNTVGQRTMEKGYRDAMVIVGNKFEPGLGGGICQVSSTLYNAVLLAGLDIAERHNHNLAVAYIPLGRDATVAWGIQDFKFKNNTSHPIYISGFTSGGKLTFTIYGNLENKQKIDVYNIIDKTLDFTTVVEPDPTLEPGTEKVSQGGQLGYVVRSFRSFLGSDGNIVKTEKLATDTYKPLNRLVMQGPEAVESEPDPDGSPQNPEKPKAHRPSKPDADAAEKPLDELEIRS